MNISKVSFSIPATSANLGPGFDSFGIALQIHNVVTLQKESRPIQHTSMIFQAAALFFTNTGITPFNFSVEVEGEVPSARGLGSSVTVRLGILLGLNELAQRPLTSSALYHLAVELEGHSDNAAPALFGGFTIARNRREPVSYQLARELCFILLIPDFEVSTASARKLLPASISSSAGRRPRHWMLLLLILLMLQLLPQHLLLATTQCFEVHFRIDSINRFENL